MEGTSSPGKGSTPWNANQGHKHTGITAPHRAELEIKRSILKKLLERVNAPDPSAARTNRCVLPLRFAGRKLNKT
jgi:hypothetical protein